MENETKKILIILPSHAFREEQYLKLREILEKGKVEVKVASSILGDLKGQKGTYLKPDLLLEKVLVSEYDGIIFVGGAGAKELFHDQNALFIIREAFYEGKIIAGICLGVLVLAYAGILVKKRATVCETPHLLEEHGAIYTGTSLEKDDNIITASAASGERAISDFAQEILKSLKEKKS